MKSSNKTTLAKNTKRPTVTLFNTLTRSVEAVPTAKDGRLTFYSCGPTVYGYAHIGNLRTFLYQDVLKRTLELAGYRVRHVMNITDVDDKTIAGAAKAGEELKTYTRRYTKAFFDDLTQLHIESADVYTFATKYIPQMVALIKKLLEKGIAYRKEGSIYFSVAKFPRYGKLARLDQERLLPGARVEADEYDKEHPSDFALWKAWTPSDGNVFWETELGKGRPGWHIECSAMSMGELGIPIDVHSGGVDLVFPHHENEIAQSEAATEKPFVKHWWHLEHLVVDGEKMSKSKKNEYTLQDIKKKGFEPLAFRYLVLQSHYRSKMNFTWEALAAAQRSLTHIRTLGLRDTGTRLEGRTKRAVEQALYSDLDTPRALAHLHEGSSFRAWQYFDGVLGLQLAKPTIALTRRQQSLLHQRETARQSGDFKLADHLRRQLSKEGVTIEDTDQGPRVIQHS